MTPPEMTDAQSDSLFPEGEPRVRIKSLTVNDGTTAPLPSVGVTCVVGANNVGKSQLLRDISYLDSQQVMTIVLKHLELESYPTNISDYQATNWLSRNDIASPIDNPPEMAPVYSSVLDGRQTTARDFASWWNQNPKNIYQIGGFFFWHASAGSLSMWASQQFSPGMEPKPLIARVFADGLLDKALSDLCEETFGFPLTFDRWTSFKYRIGTVSGSVPPANRPDIEYTHAVALLPALENQGDGVRSFLGLALVAIASKTGVLLLDEPEAFLHPGQARAMGRWIADTAAEQDKQIIIATHDRDFVLGVLEANREATMIRLTRQENINSIHKLDWSAIQELWADPVLRYSNLLQGLFHDMVIVCEGDADCRFYGAVLDSLYSSGPERAIVHNTLLVPSGGKDRMHTMIKAIKCIGGSPRIIADFDFLNDKRRLEAIVEAMGAVWDTEIENCFNKMTASSNQIELWKGLKKLGLGGLRGDALLGAKELLAKLTSIGIIIVPCGEMEDIDRTISSKKSDYWVSEMLEKKNHETSPIAKELVQAATASL